MFHFYCLILISYKITFFSGERCDDIVNRLNTTQPCDKNSFSKSEKSENVLDDVVPRSRYANKQQAFNGFVFNKLKTLLRNEK